MIYFNEFLSLCEAASRGRLRTIIGQRLKQSGMEWTARGANAIIALRCVMKSNRLEDYWESRWRDLPHFYDAGPGVRRASPFVRFSIGAGIAPKAP